MSQFFKSSIPSSQITSEAAYLSRNRESRGALSRRRFMQLGALAVGSAALAACSTGTPAGNSAQPASEPASAPSKPDSGYPAMSKTADELGDKLNTLEQITHYNNFYEFTTDKEGVASMAQNWKPTTWTVAVGGLVNKPKTYDIDDLRKKFTQEERVYRLRCVEGWSMVIPWNGFSLASLLKEVEPTANEIGRASCRERVCLAV